MTSDHKKFPTEAELARIGRSVLAEALERVKCDVRVVTEVHAPGCVPDIVVFTERSPGLGYVVTIEFKLSAWRRALRQAFRHRNFGNEAYVVLDDGQAGAAIANLDEFIDANIGLATIDTEGLVRLYHYPKPMTPFSFEFSRALAKTLFPTLNIRPLNLPYTRTVRGGMGLSPLRDLWVTVDRDVSCD